MDTTGNWAWSACTPADFVRVRDALCAFERMTWAQIRAKKSCHFTSPDAICSDAMQRLVAMKLDDTDTLMQLRLGAKIRVFGMMEGSTFNLLWWDPEHSVWPTQPANT